MRRWSSCALVSLVLLLALGCKYNGRTGSTDTVTTDPVVFDRRDTTGATIAPPVTPLTASETRFAADLAMRELTARNLRAEGPLYFVDAELLREKSAPLRRLARVTHYRYAGALTITTLVDLGDQRVVDQRSAQNVPTALAAEEVEEVRRIALADPQVQELIRPHPNVVIEPMLVHTRSREDPISGRRVVDLLFRVGRDYISGPRVRVDLNDRRVTVLPRRTPQSHM